MPAQTIQTMPREKFIEKNLGLRRAIQKPGDRVRGTVRRRLPGIGESG